MKLLIDYSKVSGVPFNKKLSGTFYFQEEKVENLKNEILYGDGSSVLISGYRGAGKTSFVNKVEEEIIKDVDIQEKLCFVKLNLTKYKGYSFLIRRIIRSVYESIPEQKLLEINKEDPDLAIKLGLLYERTFNDVTAVNNIEHSQKISNLLKTTLNGKKLFVLFISILVAALNLIFDFSGYLTDKELLSKLISWITFIGLGIWGALETFNFEFSWSKEKINKQVLNRQSLYDDEIAEHRLLETLAALKEKKMKFIIVLDELDKNDISEVENIIGELKSLMLSGYATFIIVAGQQLYYKYHSSQIEDDSILSSLFSNTIHIPLSNVENLKNMANGLIDNQGDSVSDSVNNYTSALALLANRLPRRLINLVRQELKWDGSTAYLDITNQHDKNIVLAKCLEVVQKIEENELHAGFSDGIKDFFSIQLYRWIQIIIKKNNIPFKRSELIQSDQKNLEELSPNLFRFTLLLPDLADLLIDRLLEAKILNQTSPPPGEETEEYIFTYEITESLDQENSPYSYNSNFVKNINSIITLINNLTDYVEGISEKDSMEEKVKKLIENQFLSSHLEKHIGSLNQLNSISEKLSKNISLSAQEVDLLQGSQIKSRRIKSELLESYYYHLTKRVFKNSSHKVTKRLNSTPLTRVDYFMLNNKDTNPDILFDTDLGISINDGDRLHRKLKILEEYNKFTNKENYFVVIISETNVGIEQWLERLARLGQRSEIANYIKIYLIDDYTEHSFKSFIKENLNL